MVGPPLEGTVAEHLDFLNLEPRPEDLDKILNSPERFRDGAAAAHS